MSGHTKWEDIKSQRKRDWKYRFWYRYYSFTIKVSEWWYKKRHPLIPLDEAAAMLSMTPTHLNRVSEQGLIDSIIVDDQCFYHPSEISRILDFRKIVRDEINKKY